MPITTEYNKILTDLILHNLIRIWRFDWLKGANFFSPFVKVQWFDILSGKFDKWARQYRVGQKNNPILINRNSITHWSIRKEFCNNIPSLYENFVQKFQVKRPIPQGITYVSVKRPNLPKISMQTLVKPCSCDQFSWNIAEICENVIKTLS